MNDGKTDVMSNFVMPFTCTNICMSGKINKVNVTTSYGRGECNGVWSQKCNFYIFNLYEIKENKSKNVFVKGNAKTLGKKKAE